jgi:hypothetical protein
MTISEATYTLNIYDASKTMNDNAERGHLQPFSGLQFGMYSPRPYVQNNGIYMTYLLVPLHFDANLLQNLFVRPVIPTWPTLLTNTPFV